MRMSRSSQACREADVSSGEFSPSRVSDTAEEGSAGLRLAECGKLESSEQSFIYLSQF